MKRMRTILAASILAGIGFVGSAHAAFNYIVAPVTISSNFGTGSNMTLTAYNNGVASSTLAGSQTINLAQVTETSTTLAPATDTGNIPLAPLVVTINNLNGGGSGGFTVNGTIVVTRSDTSGAISTFTPGTISPATLTLGSYVYTLSSPSYTAPTINAGSNGNGGLSYLLTETTVPEPTSFAAFGLVGAALLRRKR